MVAEICNPRVGAVETGGPPWSSLTSQSDLFTYTIQTKKEPPSRGINEAFADYDWLCLLRVLSLQSARAAYNEYRRGYDQVLQFLANTPSYQPQETDSLSQVETKLKNQKVIWLLLLCNVWEDQRSSIPMGQDKGLGHSFQCHLPSTACLCHLFPLGALHRA